MKNSAHSKRQVSKSIATLALTLLLFLPHLSPAQETDETTTTLATTTTTTVPSETSSTSVPDVLPSPALTKPKLKPVPANATAQETSAEPPKPSLKKPKAIPLENLDCAQLAKTVKERAFRCLNEVSQKQRALCCAEMDDYFSDQQEGIAVCQPLIRIVHKELLEAEKKKFSQQKSGCE